MMPKYRWQINELFDYYDKHPQFFHALKLRHLAYRT